MREVVLLHVMGQDLFGTYHVPAPPTCAGDVAVVFLNFGQAPRAGMADVAASLAEALAQRGYPTYRIDLPGLGDSPGSLPESLHDFWRAVQDGLHQPWTEEIVKQLAQDHGYESLVLGGLCGGGITAALAADHLPCGVSGVFMLEPEFMLLPLAQSEEQRMADPGITETRARLRSWSHLRSRLLSVAAWRRLLSGQSSYRQDCRTLLWIARRRLDHLRGESLPSDINRPFVEALRRLADRRMPLAIVMASSLQKELIERDIFGRARMATVRNVAVEGTNHMFATHQGKEAVAVVLHDWLCAVHPRQA